MEATAAFLLLLVLCNASGDDAGDKARFCSRERLLGLFLPFFPGLLFRGVPALLLFLLLLLPFLLDILLLLQQVGEERRGERTLVRLLVFGEPQALR